jgi:metallophosphoesterase superfamily enzyme
LSPPFAGAVALEGMLLLPGCALFRPKPRQLVVADVHLGKAASFRAKGVPVPEHSTSDNFERLDRLLALTAARQLVILGDLSHDALGRRKARDPWIRWRDRHPTLDVVLVPGNHDPKEWGRFPMGARCGESVDAARVAVGKQVWPGLRVVEPVWSSEGLVFLHDADTVSDAALGKARAVGPQTSRMPDESPAKVLALCGHRHPVVRVPTLAGRHALRRPCFFLDRRACLHLPAFGSFTGGHPVDPLPGETVFVDAVDRVLTLPRGFGARSRVGGSP